MLVPCGISNPKWFVYIRIQVFVFECNFSPYFWSLSIYHIIWVKGLFYYLRDLNDTWTSICTSCQGYALVVNKGTYHCRRVILYSCQKSHVYSFPAFPNALEYIFQEVSWICNTSSQKLFPPSKRNIILWFLCSFLCLKISPLWVEANKHIRCKWLHTIIHTYYQQVPTYTLITQASGTHKYSHHPGAQRTWKAEGPNSPIIDAVVMRSGVNTASQVCLLCVAAPGSYWAGKPCVQTPPRDYLLWHVEVTWRALAPPGAKAVSLSGKFLLLFRDLFLFFKEYYNDLRTCLLFLIATLTGTTTNVIGGVITITTSGMSLRLPILLFLKFWSIILLKCWYYFRISR